MKIKKVLAGVVAAVVAVVSLSAAAFAEEEALVSGDYQYEVLNDGTVSITKYLGSAENVAVPDTIDGKTVTAIGGEWVFSNDGALTSLEIPDTVTSLGDYSLSSCKSLAEVNIPDSVTTIGRDAFSNCTSLTEIKIPDSVTEISEFIFNGCTSLAVIEIPDSVTSIGDYAFSDCTSLETIEIPDGVTIIGYGVFEDCTSLKTIEIPNGVTWIGNGAFKGCTSLDSIVIPDKVTALGIRAFAETALTAVEIPDSVTEIEAYAFENCKSLTSVTIPASVTSFGSYLDTTGLVSDIFNGCPDALVIYGYTGSDAEAYANEHGIEFKAIGEVEPKDPTTTTTEPDVTSPVEELVAEDKETGIAVSAAAGVIPEGATLTVKADNENSDPSSVAYDITITTADGKPADINGTVTVTIPVPEELKGADKYYVFYKAEDGTLTDMKATYADGVITFTTTHFSTYIVSTVDLLEDKTTPNSGIDGVAIVAGIAIIAAAGVIISKKRK